MTNDNKKILGEERRSLILQWLKVKKAPITGSALANKTNVSRQVIVQDISLLKARNEPIIATSQGYFYFSPHDQENKVTRTIACLHRPEQTEEELNILVDHGVTVKDVSVEHPLYGDLTASIMVSNRMDVEHFMNKLKQTNATLLSQLTGGAHLHTIEGNSEAQLDEVCEALQKAGFLIDAS
ncbi:transcription repressor NadR [Bacillus solimangrovi]|uniref:Transcriptional regulator n=1 Tax=Bacillus solimangrovi TaxID=1305675 RepID=A0A1E5LBL6_9BACI|nr:transcription repressor NadR [Bacillus solimangrovi]OEH91477.1 transcriptional regulator [Bacillus solimangrovi]